mgnify:CR=1 FL=1
MPQTAPLIATAPAPQVRTQIRRIERKTETRDEVVAHVRDMFGRLDANKDGKLSRMEYLKIMAKIDTHNLRSAHAIVDTKGASKVDLGVCDKLDVNVSGVSQVTYRGDPVVNKTIHGPGKVEKRADAGA